MVPLGQAEGDVGHAQGRLDPQLLRPGQGSQGDFCVVAPGAHRHGQAVYQQLPAGDAQGLGPGDDLLGDGHAPLCRGGDAVVVQGQADQTAAVLLHQG